MKTREQLVNEITDKMFENASIDELKEVYIGYQKHDLLDYSDEQIHELADEYLISLDEGEQND